MHRFRFAQEKELKEYIYFSSIHDSEIKDIQYDICKSALTLMISNPIDKVSCRMTFAGIKRMFFLNENRWGDDNSVSSLTLEEDHTPIEAFGEPETERDEKSLYFVFQMFSGNELHILTDELLVEEI